MEAEHNMRENNTLAVKPVVVIACEVMKAELEAIAQGTVRFHFLHQGLHRTPNKMAALIQEKNR